MTHTQLCSDDDTLLFTRKWIMVMAKGHTHFKTIGPIDTHSVLSLRG